MVTLTVEIVLYPEVYSVLMLHGEERDATLSKVLERGVSLVERLSSIMRFTPY